MKRRISSRSTTNGDPLRICLLSYRSNPHSGGQGVYLRNLSRAIKDLGHEVEVVSGPPDPLLDKDIPLRHLACLDLYNPEDPFRLPTIKELSNPINLVEWLGVSTMGFPEPFTFGIRAYRFLKHRWHNYDIVHDNQSLSYGIWAINRFVPTIATIHHPITIDRAVALRTVSAGWKKLKHLRWYSFIGMQKRVSRSLSHIITVSKSARDDISKDFKVSADKFRIVPNGINTEKFYPIPEISKDNNRLIVTNSADMPLKGLYYLLQAIAEVARYRSVKLTVIGSPKKNGGIVKLIQKLGIGNLITFTGRIGDDQFVQEYAKATAAVVPSVYEGFGLPAGEAMACAVPVISTTGGALPEVVGDAGMLVPPADYQALAQAIASLLDHPEMACRLGQAGYQRVQKHFTWHRAAQKTVAAYRETLRDHR
ncbi:MAG: glycosyltransferase family 4 protein [Deltaproteobacteria bacterium]|jgi:glycosyltransferase involved in cell wall biosynthesis|nr:glycosyltransferase family 4 protein [Deltaproteobacteria bacterium]